LEKSTKMFNIGPTGENFKGQGKLKRESIRLERNLKRKKTIDLYFPWEAEKKRGEGQKDFSYTKGMDYRGGRGKKEIQRALSP